MKRLRGVLVVLLAVVPLSCGGDLLEDTWFEKARHWKHIFGVSKPNDVTLLNSWYYRSRRSKTTAFHLEVRANARWEEEIKTRYRLTLDPVPDRPEKPNGWSRCYHGEEWFTPKTRDRYEVWVEPGDREHTTLYIDKDTRDLFLCDVRKPKRYLGD